MSDPADTLRLERGLLVMTIWASFGSFGLAFILSGFSQADLLPGLLGFALILGGYVSHIIINHIFRSRFTPGEVALGFVAFIVSATGFVLSWMLLPAFPATSKAIGLIGFAALVAAFLFYMVAAHGVRGSIAMIDAARGV